MGLSGGAAPVGIPVRTVAPVRYSTGEIMYEVDDLASGGFGVAWGHTRSFLSTIYVDTDIGQGYDWQVAQWPYLNVTSVSGGITTVAYMGQAGRIVWFDFDSTTNA